MSEKKSANVTMRVRVGENELEVTGPRNFVEKKIAEFIDLQKRVPEPPAKQDRAPRSPQSLSGTIEGMSEAQLFRKLAPRTDVDRMLIAGYFLEFKQKQESFTAFEAKQVIRGAKIPPPKNPNDAINKNIKKGQMMPAGDKDGKMAFVLTSDGEEAIESMLNQ